MEEAAQKSVISFDIMSELHFGMIRSFLLCEKTLSKVKVMQNPLFNYCDEEPSQVVVLCHSLLTQKHVSGRVLAL